MKDANYDIEDDDKFINIMDETEDILKKLLTIQKVNRAEIVGEFTDDHLLCCGVSYTVYFKDGTRKRLHHRFYWVGMKFIGAFEYWEGPKAQSLLRRGIKDEAQMCLDQQADDKLREEDEN